MTDQNRTAILAERKFLQARIAAMPASARITRISAESRLRCIDEQLAHLAAAGAPHTRMSLTFNGKPVVGSHGIFVDFGMRAVGQFADAVTTVAASLAAPLLAGLSAANRAQPQLLITNTALGSFGFELEEYCQASNDGTSLTNAINHIQALLQGSLGSDDELADSAVETDDAALKKIRVFLKTLQDEQATCAFQCQDRSFRFTDVGQVRQSLARLSQDNLLETEKTLQGCFLGVLPKSRSFEFELLDGQEVIRGKLAPSVADTGLITAHLNQPVGIHVMTKQVGSGRPRYVLMELPQWL